GSSDLRFKIIDDRVGYIDFCNMSGSWQEFSTFLDSAFVSFQAKNIKHVAIDLRHNSGGDSMLGDVLFSYLTDQKYRLMGTKKWKISSQYKAYLKENGNRSEEHTSELQSRENLVCRLLLEKKNKQNIKTNNTT